MWALRHIFFRNGREEGADEERSGSSSACALGVCLLLRCLRCCLQFILCNQLERLDQLLH
jgi:hypothetical protein